MKVLKCEAGAIDRSIIQEAVTVLRLGGVVVHPTDTCYGMAVDVFNPEAVARLYQQKGMPSLKPVSILVRSLEEAQRYGYFSNLALQLARDFWPGSLTLVVPRTESLPSHFNPDVDTVGIRVIAEPISAALLNAFGGPLTTTSANAHGEPSLYSLEEISVETDLVLDTGLLLAHQKPSTILEVVGERAIMIRQGDLSLPEDSIY